MEIDVLIEEGAEGCPDASWLRDITEKVLSAQGVGADAELGLVIASQERVQELNRSYRSKDEPTDVLAFFMTSAAVKSDEVVLPFVMPPDGVLHLGEVIISYPQAVTQAKAHRHSIDRELAILIIHGVLHLLGYDHEAPEQKRQMRTREKEILIHVKERLG
ncbi:rRNA maturation RNase YbeY [Chloroflexota bacterium]